MRFSSVSFPSPAVQLTMSAAVMSAVAAASTATTTAAASATTAMAAAMIAVTRVAVNGASRARCRRDLDHTPSHQSRDQRARQERL